MWDSTQTDELALDEYEQAVFAEPAKKRPPEGGKKPVEDKEPAATSLLAIRRRDKAELEDSRDEAHLKRFRIVNYTSEDSEVGLSESKLRTYYCSVCGSHALIVNADLEDLPTRTTDAAIALKVQKIRAQQQQQLVAAAGILIVLGGFVPSCCLLICVCLCVLYLLVRCICLCVVSVCVMYNNISVCL
eukprot:GHVS01069635.1.p1 GENE.GHVS01069635.1~~GHVS01069635.1.p1  ORF type:complete len:188 (+),score=41.36 GHVS01069635.1:222-785(+)